MLNLSTKDTAQGPKNLLSLRFQYIENLREEDPSNKGHFENNINSAALSFIFYYDYYKNFW